MTELVPQRSEKKFKPGPKNRILVNVTGVLLKNFNEHHCPFLLWESPPEDSLSEFNELLVDIATS